jgi:acetyltransferase
MGEVNQQPRSVDHFAATPFTGVAPADGGAVGERGAEQTIALTRPLDEAQWEKVRTFVRRTTRDDLRLRFGQPLDFTDGVTLRRFFGIGGACAEQLWALDDAGDICGILHRVRTAPGAAELALIVRSDRKRRGLGEALLRAALARAAAQHLTILRAYVLGENGAMLRLARKVGFVVRQRTGFSVELEFNVQPVVVAAGAKRPEAFH